jgi:phosphate-selective porin OprO/OprP
VTNSTEFQIGAASQRARSKSWQLAAAWVVTGENTSWRGVSRPTRSPRVGGLGALEVARASRLNMDGDLFRTTRTSTLRPTPRTPEWGVGLNCT